MSPVIKPRPAAPLNASNSSEQNQNQHHDEDEANPTAAIISRAVEAASANAAKSSQEGNDKNNDQDCANRHDVVSRRRPALMRGPQTRLSAVPATVSVPD